MTASMSSPRPSARHLAPSGMLGGSVGPSGRRSSPSIAPPGSSDSLIGFVVSVFASRDTCSTLAHFFGVSCSHPHYIPNVSISRALLVDLLTCRLGFHVPAVVVLAARSGCEGSCCLLVISPVALLPNHLVPASCPPALMLSCPSHPLLSSFRLSPGLLCLFAFVTRPVAW